MNKVKELKGSKFERTPGHRNSRFQTFEELEVYKKAREFRSRMYVVTRKLPDFEKYDLGRQIRRAAVSSTSNIAEGHGRYHYLDEIKFQIQSRGSLAELVDDLNLCQDEQYIPAAEVAELKERAKEVQRLLNGYIRFLRNRKSATSLIIQESHDCEFVTGRDITF